MVPLIIKGETRFDLWKWPSINDEHVITKQSILPIGPCLDISLRHSTKTCGVWPLKQWPHSKVYLTVYVTALKMYIFVWIFLLCYIQKTLNIFLELSFDPKFYCDLDSSWKFFRMVYYIICFWKSFFFPNLVEI